MEAVVSRMRRQTGGDCTTAVAKYQCPRIIWSARESRRAAWSPGSSARARSASARADVEVLRGEIRLGERRVRLGGLPLQSEIFSASIASATRPPAGECGRPAGAPAPRTATGTAPGSAPAARPDRAPPGTGAGRARGETAPAPADRAGRWRSSASPSAGRVRQLDVALHALEARGHRIRWLDAVDVLVGRREPSRQLLLAGRFDGLARRRERGGEHQVRVAVGRVAPHGLAQPVDGGLACRAAASRRSRD